MRDNQQTITLQLTNQNYTIHHNGKSKEVEANDVSNRLKDFLQENQVKFKYDNNLFEFNANQLSFIGKMVKFQFYKEKETNLVGLYVAEEEQAEQAEVFCYYLKSDFVVSVSQKITQE